MFHFYKICCEKTGKKKRVDEKILEKREYLEQGKDLYPTF